MPTYLVHGFRWPRPLIRIHIILNNLDDCAAEWLMSPISTSSIRANLVQLHPSCMTHLPQLRFIEQFDPSDLSSKSQPYAYVCDVVHEIRLGVEIDSVRGKGLSNEVWGAMVDLRDSLAPGEKVAWFVVVCGDDERPVPPTVAVSQTLRNTTNGFGEKNSAVTGSVTTMTNIGDEAADEEAEKIKRKGRFAKLFSRKSSSNSIGVKAIRRTQR